MKVYKKNYYFGYPENFNIQKTIFGFIMKDNDEFYYRFYDYSDVKSIASKEGENRIPLFFSKSRQRVITSRKTAVASIYGKKDFKLDDKLLRVYDRINQIFIGNHEEAIYSDFTVALIRFIYKNYVYEINPYTFNLKNYCKEFYDDLFLDYRNEMIKIIKEELNIEHIFFDVRLFENNKHYH